MIFILLLLNQKVQRWEGMLMNWRPRSRNTVLTELMKGSLNAAERCREQTWEIIPEHREHKEKGEKRMKSKKMEMEGRSQKSNLWIKHVPKGSTNNLQILSNGRDIIEKNFLERKKGLESKSQNEWPALRNSRPESFLQTLSININ